MFSRVMGSFGLILMSLGFGLVAPSFIKPSSAN